MRGNIDWMRAIAGEGTNMTYLWGGPSQEGERIGDAGTRSKTFEFERNYDELKDGGVFFFRLTLEGGGFSNNFGMGVARSHSSMYSFGAHIYPIVEERWRIVKEIKP